MNLRLADAASALADQLTAITFSQRPLIRPRAEDISPFGQLHQCLALSSSVADWAHLRFMEPRVNYTWRDIAKNRSRGWASPTSRRFFKDFKATSDGTSSISDSTNCLISMRFVRGFRCRCHWPHNRLRRTPRAISSNSPKAVSVRQSEAPRKPMCDCRIPHHRDIKTRDSQELSISTSVSCAAENVSKGGPNRVQSGSKPCPMNQQSKVPASHMQSGDISISWC
jgi:hypothetical protein